MKKQIFNIFIILIMLFTITGCKKNNTETNEQANNKVETYNLNVVPLNGNKKDQIPYNKGSEVKAPKEPTRQGFIFAGWYYDLAYTKKVEFPFIITKDTAIYAAWYTELMYEYEEETDSYTVIGSSLYVEEVIIPSEHEGKPVTKIGENAFENKTKLTKVTLPDTIIEIEDGAFNYCSNLLKVNLPEGLQKIGLGIFSGCDKLEYENINGLKYINNWLVDASGVVMERATFKDTTIGIFPNAFKNNNSLEELVLPNNIKYIYEGTFKNSSITKLVIGDNVEYINMDALKDTLFLEEIEVSNNNKYYSSLNGILYDKDKTKLLHYPTERNSSEYVMPNTVAEVASYACMNNKYLISLILSSELRIVNSYAFFKCSKLTNITFGEKLEIIGNEAFKYNTELKEIILPSSVKQIGENAFEYAMKVEKLQMPFVSKEGTDYSVGYIFGGIEKIPTTLIRLYILNGDSIKLNSLEGLTNIVELTIPASIENIEHGSLSHSSKLAKLNLMNNSNYKLVNNVLYTSDEKTLVYYLPTNKNLTYQTLSKTKVIAKHAFKNVSALTTITLNEGLENIEEQAFCEMQQLVKLIIPTTVKITGQDICFVTPNVIIYTKFDMRQEGWSEGWNTLNYPVKWNSYFPKFEDLELERHLNINESYEITFELVDAPENASVIVEALLDGVVTVDGLKVTGFSDGIVQLKIYVEGYEEEYSIITIYVGQIE